MLPSFTYCMFVMCVNLRSASYGTLSATFALGDYYYRIWRLLLSNKTIEKQHI